MYVRGGGEGRCKLAGVGGGRESRRRGLRSIRVKEYKGIRVQKMRMLVVVLDFVTIPPLRGPTRRKTARKRRSGRSGRDDSLRIGGRRMQRHQYL
jgi:hypothetical protein